MNSTKRMALISTIVWLLLLLAAGVSASHIVATAHKLGLHGWQVFTAPALIDLVAIVGKLSMHPHFTDAFRKSGFRLLMAGGTLSLACNVYAGNTLGERIFGVVVVGAFMLLEHHATKGGSKAVAKGRKLDPAEATRRATLAKATRERNNLAKEAAAEAERWANMSPAQRGVETRKRNAVAPTSPAPAGQQV